MLIIQLCGTWKVERQCVWTARASLQKYTFLFYRYGSLIGIIFVFVTISGFQGIQFRNSCETIQIITTITAVISQVLGNGLVLNHVIQLWGYNRKVTALAVICYGLAYLTTLVTYVRELVAIHAQQQPVWIDELRVCGLSISVPKLLVLALAAPVAFKIFMLVALLWNVLDRPRQINTSLLQSMREDKIKFYVAMLTLQCIMTVGAATGESAIFFLTTMSSWPLITLAINRVVLSLREKDLATGLIGRRADLHTESIIPLSSSGLTLRDRLMLKNTPLGPDRPIELQRVVEVDLSRD